MIYWVLLFIAFGLGYWLSYRAFYRKKKRLEEKRYLLEQENQIIVNFMHQSLEVMEEGLDHKELFDRLAHTAVFSVGAFGACVFERVEDQLTEVAKEGLFPPQNMYPEKTATRVQLIEKILRPQTFRLREGIIGSVAASGKGVLITDAKQHEDIPWPEDPLLQIKTLIVVPVFFREKNRGVLVVVNKKDGGLFNDVDFALIRSLGEQAGMVIQNADLIALRLEKNQLDSDLTLAESIQAMLLPERSSPHQQLDIDARYLPAQKVGGDFYDYFSLDDDRVGVAIGDVSGKGIPASLLMALCQNNLRHFAKESKSPASTLMAINRVMRLERRKEMFITIIYAIIDLKQNELILARAGHELPIMIEYIDPEQAHKIQSIPSEGIALGLVPSEIFDGIICEQRLPFVPGSALTLFTDGVNEALNEEGVEFSTQRLIDTIERFQACSAQAINQRILDAVNCFSARSTSFDDRTLLTVKRCDG